MPSSYVESQSVLEARLEAVRLGDVKDALIQGGITCLAELAFISSYTPGVADETPLISAFEQLLGQPATLVQKTNFRRLFNEAYAAVTQDIRQEIERVEDRMVRKLTQPERHERYTKQCSKLTGVSIKGPSEPSDSLVDSFCAMYDDNRLRFLDWDKCISKEQEMASEKRCTSFSVDGSGKLKIESKADSVDKADTSNEIMLLQALTRRSLAMDQANLVDFTKIQEWVDKLIRSRTTEPPPGFNKPSFRNLMLADQRFFLEMADRTRSGVQPTGCGRPMDSLMSEVMSLSEVTCFLQPVMQTATREKESQHPRDEPYPRRPKGKGKGKSSNARMPVDLIGCRSHTNAGAPICYGYNLGTCQEEVKSGKCSRGFHICAVPKCGKHHPANKCPNWKKDPAAS